MSSGSCLLRVHVFADKLLMLTRCHQFFNKAGSSRERASSSARPAAPPTDEDDDDGGLSGFEESDDFWGSDASLDDLGNWVHTVSEALSQLRSLCLPDFTHSCVELASVPQRR